MQNIQPVHLFWLQSLPENISWSQALGDREDFILSLFIKVS